MEPAYTDSSYSKSVLFSGSSLSTDGHAVRYIGMSVRLVQDLE